MVEGAGGREKKKPLSKEEKESHSNPTARSNKLIHIPQCELELQMEEKEKRGRTVPLPKFTTSSLRLSTTKKEEKDGKKKKIHEERGEGKKERGKGKEHCGFRSSPTLLRYIFPIRRGKETMARKKGRKKAGGRKERAALQPAAFFHALVAEAEGDPERRKYRGGRKKKRPPIKERERGEGKAGRIAEAIPYLNSALLSQPYIFDAKLKGGEGGREKGIYS